jgi:glutaredoxin
MYLILGKQNCNACKITQTVLKNKGIEFEYKYLSDLSQEDQDKYIQMAQEQDKLSLPLIIKDNKLFTIQEVK